METFLANGEIIIEKIRKHWIVYVEDFLLHLFGCLIFSVSAFYLSWKGVLSFIGTTEKAYGSMVLLMFVLIFWTSYFFAWTKNYFDVWYVTDKHIVAVDQKQILEREEAYMELIRIQDVSFEKSGFFQTFFDYGVLKVQSAGEEQEFVIHSVHDVERVAHRILDLRDDAQKVHTHNGNVYLS
jgi:uncharacterized membrane protein YdbT with pleckstrin-like domain